MKLKQLISKYWYKNISFGRLHFALDIDLNSWGFAARLSLPKAGDWLFSAELQLLCFGFFFGIE